jgi:copper chaperone CopZ
MRSNDCRERMIDVLGQIDGVSDVQVSLFRARATVSHRTPCTEAILLDAVARAGYGAAVDTGERRTKQSN